MKTLKFTHNLVEKILNGTKTVTWRLFDDKDLSVGDYLELIDSSTKEKFVKAKIIDKKEKRLGELTEQDFKGHETYESKEEMLKIYKGYYGDQVNWETIIKIIKFKLLRAKR